MNGYKCFSKDGRSVDVYADTALDAQRQAAALLKVKKTYQVAVYLCEKQGEQITHIASD